jgi:hypothetical protein
MNGAREMKMSRVYGFRLLSAAIAVSLGWHLFWIAAIKVAAPSSAPQAKFSKVSFLGPLLSSVSMEVRRDEELSFLEKRELASIAGPGSYSGAIPVYVKVESDRPAPGEMRPAGSVTAMVDEVLAIGKVEPDFGA